jgi:CRP/FNR family transcriptional regulator, transcriptional activator FtrB
LTDRVCENLTFDSRAGLDVCQVLDMPDQPTLSDRVGAEPDLRPTGITPDLAELRGHPIFDGLEAGHVRHLLASCRGLQYRAGSIIVDQGASFSGLYIIYRGLVDLAHIHGDHDCGVLLLSTKDLLLPAAALYAEASLVSARALTTTKLVTFEAGAVNRVREESGVLTGNLLKAVSGQWRMAVRNILDLNCRTAAQRLASFLLRLVDLQAGAGPPILPIAKRHLASRLGMTAETLSRMLQVVADNGVHLRGRMIIVHDRARAEKFCGPDPYPSSDERALNVFAL